MTEQPDFRHLAALTDERGTFEHARFGEPGRTQLAGVADAAGHVAAGVATPRELDRRPHRRRIPLQLAAVRE